ncbi:MAG TPA: hypothetical protein VHD60_00495 [Candidatus Saccharimonadales bacterium]|nr:hypothetical protein [Candidatus Saccharimonadales bacterium]
MKWYEYLAPMSLPTTTADIPLYGGQPTLSTPTKQSTVDPESELLALGVRLKGLDEYDKKDWMSLRERGLDLLSRHKKLSAALACMAIISSVAASKPAIVLEGLHGIQDGATASLDRLVLGLDPDLSTKMNSGQAHGPTSIPTSYIEHSL